MKCLDPPLELIPDDDWYCPDCYNDKNEIVQAGEKGSKFSKRNSKMPSRQENGKKKRDWGKGLATAGRTKTCTLVKNNYFGAIPGL
jgi:E3 ubiquitin-protein ligase UHRF1